MKSAHLLQLFLSHLTTWQSFSEKCCQGGDHYQGRSPGFKSGQMQRDCAEFLHKQSPPVHWWMDHSPVPASYLALPLILSSSSGLIHWVSITLSLSFSPLLLCHEHDHMCTYYTTNQGGCPYSRNRGASVGQSLAINRLLEFIIVSSYDGEEPRGLGEREESRPSSITLCWLLLPAYID